MRNLFVSTLILITGALLAACNRTTPSPANQGNNSEVSSLTAAEDSTPKSNTDDSAEQGILELRSVAARQEQGVLADEIRLSDQKGEWKTEAFHESIKPHLKKLGRMFKSQRWEDINQLIVERFLCSDLRPKNTQMNLAFEDKNFSVFRPTAALPLTAAQSGATGFLTSLQQLASPFKTNSQLSIHFKVFKVSLNGENAESEIYVDTDGIGQNGGVQQNMQWKCEWQRKEPDTWKLTSIRLAQFEEVHYRRSGDKKMFSDCTNSVLAANRCNEEQLQLGIDHWRLRIEERFGIDSVSLTGLAVADVNGDGLDDLYFCDAGGLPNRLFVQQQDGTAIDVSAAAGVDWLDRSRGALFADLDNDGDQDLIVSLGTSLLLMANDGTGKFSARARLHPHPTAQSLSAVDYNNDGRLDIYVCSYGNSLETFADSQTPMPWHDANNGASNSMFRSDGDWKFTDVTADVGLNENNLRYSYAASWEDFDNDGDQDLYVANDFGRNNLFVNDGGHFRDSAPEFGVEDKSLGMSADWADYNNDGRMDLYIGNMFSGAGNRVTFQERFMTGSSAQLIQDYRHSARGNTLFQQQASNSFDDVSFVAGVTMGRWSWSSVFADINNDGWQDLIVTNGHVTGIDADDL